MNKIISFLREKNRFKRLIIGLLVGLFAFNPWTAIYSAVVAASCFEFKNVLNVIILGFVQIVTYQHQCATEKILTAPLPHATSHRLFLL